MVSQEFQMKFQERLSLLLKAVNYCKPQKQRILNFTSSGNLFCAVFFIYLFTYLLLIYLHTYLFIFQKCP